MDVYQDHELHIIIDWTCKFESLEDKITDSLIIVDKIRMEKLSNKVKVLSAFYNVNVNDFRGSTAFNVYIIKDMKPIYNKRSGKTCENRVKKNHWSTWTFSANHSSNNYIIDKHYHN